MSNDLIDRLTSCAEQHRGSDLGGLLQWAVLHIQSQDEALAEAREEAELLDQRAQEMETGLRLFLEGIKAAGDALFASLPTTPDFSRDMAPWINLMGGHGDPDYLTKAVCPAGMWTSESANLGKRPARKRGLRWARPSS